MHAIFNFDEDFKGLKKLNIQAEEVISFPDHHRYIRRNTKYNKADRKISIV